MLAGLLVGLAAKEFALRFLLLACCLALSLSAQAESTDPLVAQGMALIAPLGRVLTGNEHAPLWALSNAFDHAAITPAGQGRAVTTAPYFAMDGLVEKVFFGPFGWRW